MWNFVGSATRGVNNLCTKLTAHFQTTLKAVDYRAHINHKAINSSADCLTVDFEVVIVKIYEIFFTFITLKWKCLRI